MLCLDPMSSMGIEQVDVLSQYYKFNERNNYKGSILSFQAMKSYYMAQQRINAERCKSFVTIYKTATKKTGLQPKLSQLLYASSVHYNCFSSYIESLQTVLQNCRPAQTSMPPFTMQLIQKDGTSYY